MNCFVRLFLFIAAAVLVTAQTQKALAFVEEGQLGAIHYRVMAPDWVCRGEVVSVLIVASTDSPAAGVDPLQIVATFTPPLEGFDAPPQATLERRLDVRPGEVHRFSFTGWKAQVDKELGKFAFKLRLANPRQPESVDLTFTVDTIRGAAVPRGIWSILVPAAISLLALPAFALFIKRFARRGAWKEAVDLEIPPSEEAWWKSVT